MTFLAQFLAQRVRMKKRGGWSYHSGTNWKNCSFSSFSPIFLSSLSNHTFGVSKPKKLQSLEAFENLMNILNYISSIIGKKTHD